MKEAILNLLREYGDGVSFVQLSKLPGFKGNIPFGYPDKNLFFWFSCSEKASDTLTELQKNKQIKFKAVDPLLIYVPDRLMPPVPVAKSMRKYSTPRWFPVVLYLGDGL